MYTGFQKVVGYAAYAFLSYHTMWVMMWSGGEQEIWGDVVGEHAFIGDAFVKVRKTWDRLWQTDPRKRS
jgi:hypothetical protein